MEALVTCWATSSMNARYDMVRHRGIQVLYAALLYLVHCGVTENIRSTRQTQVLGHKPKYVLKASHALCPLESLGQPHNAEAERRTLSHCSFLSCNKHTTI
ncbi:hypothetical protein TNCV_1955811 [Trichonephila clavipes]|nr:hypothetical protein TNCV_1955811 [Trichonephila clavipes]